MIIQTEQIWLFETSITDPFFFGTKDGVQATMSNPRSIALLDIAAVSFYMDQVVKGGLTYSIKYGGEDNEIQESYGKSAQGYKLEANIPTVSEKLIEKLVGKEFSLLAMRRDGTFFVIFARLVVDGFDIDNVVRQRVTFKAANTNTRIYNVESFNVGPIDESITCDTIGALTDGGFDYELDFLLD